MGESVLNDFLEALDRLREQDPEFNSEEMTPRAKGALDDVFHVDGDRSKPSLSDQAVEKNMRLFVLRVNAVLEQMKNNPVWQNRLTEVRNGVRQTVAATLDEWRRAPATAYKTFQKKLTNELFRIDFSRESRERDYSDMIIDPGEINDTLLRNLGLIEEKKGKGKQRLSKIQRMERNIEFIPQIHGMIQKLEPFRLPGQQKDLQLRCFRLFRIGDGPKKGFVMGAQSINRDDYALFETDLYGALRRIGHIKVGYDKEIVTMTEIQTLVEEVWNMIDKDWPDAKTRIPEIREKLLACVDKLKHVKNEHKVLMRERIEQFVDIKCVRKVPAKFGWKEDGTRGKVREEREISVFSPGAAKAAFRSIPGLVGKRLKEMRNISGRLAMDEADLKKYIADQEKLFQDFYRRVEAQHRDFAILHIDEPLSLDKTAKIKGNLQALASQCDPNGRVTFMAPFFEPHLAFAEKMSPHLYRAADLLDKDRTEAAREFTMAYLVAKLENFYLVLEKFYRTELPPAQESADFNQLLKKIEMLNGLLAKKTVSAYVTGADGQSEPVFLETPEYDEIFGAVYHLLNSLKKRAREGRSAQEERLQVNIPGATPEELTEEQSQILQKQILMQMKNRIKEMRFDRLMRDGREDDAFSESKVASVSDDVITPSKEPHPAQE